MSEEGVLGLFLGIRLRFGGDHDVSCNARRDLLGLIR